MSRIHDALKRIAEEKQASPAGAPAHPPVPASDGVASLTLDILRSSRPGAVANVTPAPALPDLRRQCAQPGWNLASSGNVFASPSLCAEQFRKLRSHLYQLRSKEAIRVVQVTSALPGEGKTFTAFNLALAISRDRGRRVLLVDADLRASRLAVYLGAPGAPGLGDCLRGAAEEGSAIQADAHSDLFFMPAGDPVKNPTELLAGGRFQGLVERLAPMFDWVIVDTPPVLPVSDAGVLAGACDGALVVVRAAATGYDQVDAALKELPAGKVLGVVLNRAEEELPRGAYEYYAGMADGRPALGPGARRLLL